MLWAPSPDNDPCLIHTWKVNQLLRCVMIYASPSGPENVARSCSTSAAGDMQMMSSTWSGPQMVQESFPPPSIIASSSGTRKRASPRYAAQLRDTISAHSLHDPCMNLCYFSRPCPKTTLPCPIDHSSSTHVHTVDLWMQRSLTGHRHYVQGVTWDPLGEHILTQSTDRTMRVHRARAAKKRARPPANDVLAAADFVQAASVSKRPLLSTEPSASSRGATSPSGKQPADTPAAEPPAVTAGAQCPQGDAKQQQPAAASPPERPASQRQPASRTTYIFQDECLNTFFRRLSFSPEGSFVVAPAATLGPLAPVPQCAPHVLQ